LEGEVLGHLLNRQHPLMTFKECAFAIPKGLPLTAEDNLSVLLYAAVPLPSRI